jgi:hypothetical protein
MGLKLLDGTANGFITQQALGHAVLVAYLRRESQRPHPCGLAIGARRLLPNMLEAFTLGGIQRWRNGLRTIRLLPQALHTLGIKGMHDIADSLDRTAYKLGNRLRRQATGTREDDLSPSDPEGVRAAAVGLPRHTLSIGQGANKER